MLAECCPHGELVGNMKRSHVGTRTHAQVQDVALLGVDDRVATVQRANQEVGLLGTSKIRRTRSKERVKATQSLEHRAADRKVRPNTDIAIGQRYAALDPLLR